MKSFTIHYSITENDYLKFNEYHLRHTQQGKRTLLAFRVLALLLSGFGFVLAAILRPRLSFLVLLFIGLTVFSVVWWLVARRYIMYTTARNLKKAKAKGKLPYTPQGQLVFDFENRMLTEMAEGVELKVPFEKIIAFYQTEDAFYFHIQENQAFILPFYQFLGTDEFTTFREAVNANFTHG